MVGVEANFFLELGVVIIIAGLAGMIFRYFKQPQILAYVLVGIMLQPILKGLKYIVYLVSSNGFFAFDIPSITSDIGIIEPLALIGIAFLLFIVGLEMDLKALRNVALVSSLGGTIQVLLLFTIGYFVALLLDFVSLEAAYIGLMIAFSSTMVVMKLLSDKRELHTLHGRLAVGILLMQDIIAILAISILTAVNGFSSAILGIALIKFIALFGVAYVASKFIFPHMFRFAAKHQELLLILSLSVCFMFSLIFHYLGFSIAIGAFIAGVTLGTLEYNIEIIAKVKSLKDFFSLLFFVSLGMGISLSVLKELWLPLLILLAIVMVIKPLVIMTICSLFKFTKKPSFLTANSLAQVGEFSLILATQGLLLGHISQDVFSLAVIITLISITLTSYYIQYNQFFYKLLQKPLKIFDSFTTEGLEYLPTKAKPNVVLCGHSRIGYSILRQFTKVKKNVLIIDFNPEIITKLVKDGYHCIYGEATDEEIIDRMNLPGLRMLISTVPNKRDNLLLIRKTRKSNRKAKIIVTANDIDEALDLYEEGADYVILPHFLGGEHVSNLITDMRSKKVKIHEERKKHIEHLEERKDEGHEHPKHH